MKSIVMHPKTLARFSEACRLDSLRSPDRCLFGLPIYVNELAPQFVTRRWWEFPRDPFVQYEPSDEVWCRFFGIGIERSELTNQPWICIMDRDEGHTFFLAMEDAAPFNDDVFQVRMCTADRVMARWQDELSFRALERGQ